MSIKPFTMGVKQPQIGCQIEVSTMLDTCTYSVFTLYGSCAVVLLLQIDQLQKHVNENAALYFNNYCQKT